MSIVTKVGNDAMVSRVPVDKLRVFKHDGVGVPPRLPVQGHCAWLAFAAYALESTFNAQHQMIGGYEQVLHFFAVILCSPGDMEGVHTLNCAPPYTPCCAGEQTCPA